jgi:hypothetical protein
LTVPNIDKTGGFTESEKNSGELISLAFETACRNIDSCFFIFERLNLASEKIKARAS